MSTATSSSSASPWTWTQRETGNRFKMDETALYTIKNGKIAEERFFYGG